MSKKKFIKIMKELIKMRREHSVYSKGQETVNMFSQYERIIIDLIKNEFENGEIIEEYAITNGFRGIWVNDVYIASYPADVYDLLIGVEE